MSSELVLDELTGRSSAGSIAVTAEGGTVTTNLQQGLTKAWVNFNGTGTSAGATITARDSFNTTSITDVNTGDYTITIANNMANDDYAHAGDSGGTNNSSNGNVYCNDQGTARTTTLFRVYTLNSSASPSDPAQVNIMVCGDLA
jgi:hypothetical protein